MQEQAPRAFTNVATGETARQLEQALASCHAALKKNPRDAGCLCAMGLIEAQLGRADAAEKWLKRALTIAPAAPDIRFHYAVVLLEQAKYAPAVAAFKQLLALDKKNADAWYHLGNAQKGLGATEEVEQSYRRAIEVDPNHAGSLNNLGNILARRGENAQAIACYERAIAAKPDYAIAFNNLGMAFVAIGILDQAEMRYRRALALQPVYPEAHNNLGIVLRMRGALEEGKAHYQMALKQRPGYAEALNNLGNAMKDSGQVHEALALYRQAIEKQDLADYRHNMAMALLAVGHYDEGWREYEQRWKGKHLAVARRDFAQPLWHGEAGQGQTLFIYAEQGFGDTLQFCRYATLAAARGFRVIMEVQPALARLMRSLAGVERVIAYGEPLPDFDLQCPMMSLPLAFGTQPDSIPAKLSYLSADMNQAAEWRQRLDTMNHSGLRVGLVWAGNPRRHAPELAATDRRRSVSPELLKPLTAIEGIQFFSLQKMGTAAPPELGLIDFMQECKDFADTAALITNLDLVISVDTSVAHLAGALGKPVWLLNRFDSCWRWFEKREDSPWYPTLRIFRQAAPGEWRDVINNVCDALKQFD